MGIITKSSITICILSIFSSFIFAQEGRFVKELSGENWNLWLDQTALWYNDDIYLPPVDISSLAVNPPICGWQSFE